MDKSTGVSVAVGTTAGVAESDPLVTEKALVVAGEAAPGRAAGTTVPVWVDVLHPRPWHAVELGLGVELLVTAGRPFTGVVVALGWAVVVVPEPVVGVVVVPVVVGDGVVVVDVVVGLVVV
ncbi:MAG TPA: hypothetical protein VFH80_15015 [Solirubrobacteraceae bacterium]|nr:hypothetical protein [Solirubrobacteraceae bacterium]